MPARAAADVQRERKRKNADAQAQFRQRRANYISSLEEAVTKLEAVVLELQDSLSRAQTECHRAAEEKRQMRAYIEELERARGGLRLHEGRPYEEGQPANETSPISNSSRHARDGEGLHPVLAPLKPYTLLGPDKDRGRQGSRSPPASPHSAALRKDPQFPDDPQESRRRVDQQFLDNSWPGSPPTQPPYLPRVPPIFTHPRRSASPSGRHDFSPSTAAMTPTHMQYIPEMHQGMKLYNPIGPPPPHVQGMPPSEMPGVHPMLRHGEPGGEFVPAGSPGGGLKMRHPLDANGGEEGAPLPASNTLAVIKAQAFGALRRNRVHKKKGNGYATKVALDALEARGLGLGLQPTHALSSSRYDDRGDDMSEGEGDSGMED